MSLIQMLVKEMQQEAQTTRKMLERVPNDKYNWQPHPKSMTIRQLATHIAELPSWVSLALTTDCLDFATSPYNPVTIHNTTELLDLFERSLAEGEEALSQATDDQLAPEWILRNGDQILSQTTKGEMIRMSFSQIVHHRAQLGVDLRLLDIPIPGSYGPSADEPGF
ncbi:DinB family protein [Spirosoma aerophilum]